jgi:phosphonate transport system permease protein
MGLLSLLALGFADLNIQHRDPWFECSLLLHGLASPVWLGWDLVAPALCKTLAFAVQGVLVSAILGFGLALCYHLPLVRSVAAFARAVHELFWALLFIQVTGLSPLTGFLAILIPYTGFFAKVFAEIFEECDRAPELSLPPSTSYLSSMVYTRIIIAWPLIRNYVAYRFECGIRSSAVLGFVGLPTLGFELETYFRQGDYGEAAGLLYLFFLIIFSLRFAFRIFLLPIYLLCAFVYLPPVAHVSWPLLVTFLTEDIIPKALREGDAVALFHWAKDLWQTQAQEGVLNSLILGQLALITTGCLSLFLFPFRSALFFSKGMRSVSHFNLVIMRSCPEYLLAFVALLLLGPSMLPAIFALGIHNSAIIAHLLALQTLELKLRADVCHGFNLYFFEVLPRLYGSFLSLLFYRWEMILRETAILGMLGIPTLGFYIDSAFEDIRFDRAVFLILISACLNLVVDRISVTFRRCLHIHHQPESV